MEKKDNKKKENSRPEGTRKAPSKGKSRVASASKSKGGNQPRPA